MEGLISEKMSRLKLEAVAVMVLVLLAACGDEDAGPSRAGVQETSRTEQSGAPTPPAEEPGPISAPMTEPVPSAWPTPPAQVAEAGEPQASDANERALTRDHKLVSVRRGDLVTSISIYGRIAFPNTRKVIFETQGALDSVVVEEGQTVKAGQPLAHMDRATVTALEEALAQARFDASMAREALADALVPHGPLEVAKAEAVVADAKETLRTAEERLLSLLRPTDREMATAESVRADAILKIDGLLDEIDSLVGGPDEKELEHLQVHARSDQVLLENALRGESLAEEEWDARIAPVKREVEEGEEEYRALFLHWLSVGKPRTSTSACPLTPC